MLVAVTRPISPAMTRCELTHLTRSPIDLDRARQQHREYERALTEVGCRVVTLPEEPDLPDSVFVEDTALVLAECAVITRPGAVSRRPETTAVEQLLAGHRPRWRIEEPATLDGGDVLRVGRALFVGLTGRTNAAAVHQLRDRLAEWGYDVRGVPVVGCLHLKSAVTEVAAGTLLINPAWVGREHFPGFDFLEVDPAEPAAANALRIGDRVIYPAEHPRTRDRLVAAGVEPRLVPASEVAKAEGGVTCCSLVFEAPDRPDR